MVLYSAAGDLVESYTLPELRAIYRHVGRTAYCFVIEYAHQAIGDCWLQQMNLERVLQRYAGCDSRRIDLVIGEPRLWGQVLGTEMIRLLTDFGFRHEAADLICGCDIADYNPASLKAFQRVGYRVIGSYDQPAGSKAQRVHDVALLWEQYRGAPQVR